MRRVLQVYKTRTGSLLDVACGMACVRGSLRPSCSFGFCLCSRKEIYILPSRHVNPNPPLVCCWNSLCVPNAFALVAVKRCHVGRGRLWRICCFWICTSETARCSVLTAKIRDKRFRFLIWCTPRIFLHSPRFDSIRFRIFLLHQHLLLHGVQLKPFKLSIKKKFYTAIKTTASNTKMRERQNAIPTVNFHRSSKCIITQNADTSNSRLCHLHIIVNHETSVNMKGMLCFRNIVRVPHFYDPVIRSSYLLSKEQLCDLLGLLGSLVQVASDDYGCSNRYPKGALCKYSTGWKVWFGWCCAARREAKLREFLVWFSVVLEEGIFILRYEQKTWFWISGSEP